MDEQSTQTERTSTGAEPDAGSFVSGLKSIVRKLTKSKPPAEAEASPSPDAGGASAADADSPAAEATTEHVDLDWVFEAQPDVPARIHALRERIGLPRGEWFDQFWFEAARADYRMRKAGHPEFLPVIFTAPANLGKSTIINTLVGQYLSAESWTGGSTKRLVAVFHENYRKRGGFLDHIYASYKLLEDPREAIEDGEEVLVAFHEGVPGTSLVLYDIPGNNIEGLTVANRRACAQAILHIILTNATFYNDEHQRELLHKIVKAGGTKPSIIIYRSDPSISPAVMRQHCEAIADLIYDTPREDGKFPDEVLGVYTVDPVPWQEADSARERGEVLPLKIQPAREGQPELRDVLESFDKNSAEVKRQKTKDDWALLADSLGRQIEAVRRQARYLELVKRVLDRLRDQTAAGAIESLLSDRGQLLVPTLNRVWNRSAPGFLSVLKRMSDRMSRPVFYLTEAFRRFLRPVDSNQSEVREADIPQALLEEYRREIEKESRHLKGALRSEGVTLVRDDDLFKQAPANAALWDDARAFRREFELGDDEYPKVFEDAVEVKFPERVAKKVPDVELSEIDALTEPLLENLQMNFAHKLAKSLKEKGRLTALFLRTSIWPIVINLLSIAGLVTIAWDLSPSLWPDVPVAAIVLLVNPRLDRLGNESLKRVFRPILTEWFHENLHERLSELYREAVIGQYQKALDELAIDSVELGRLEKAIAILKETEPPEADSAG